MLRHKKNLFLAIASLLAVVALMTATSPVNNLIYAVFFFVFILIFLVSFGYLFIRAQMGEVSPKNRYRIVALSLLLIILVMFRSAQSLNWVDGVILLLIAFGLVFYISRRA